MTVRGVFVTGTDTGVGKTWVTAALARAALARGLRVRAMKPVASGAIDTPDGPRSEDALALLDALRGDAAQAVSPAAMPAAAPPDYATVNPILLREPLSPHIAARHEGRTITLAPLLAAYGRLVPGADFVVVEGAGGWAVPLSDTLMQADLARALTLPIVLVVGVRLGCINHALLSARAIRADGFTLAGWIANDAENTLPAAAEAVSTIAAHLGPPLAALAAGGKLAPHVIDALLA